MIKSPDVLATGNATDTDPTADPCTAFAWTNPIPPPLDAVIVRLRALLLDTELASVTCTVKLLVPVPVGVPEITPVLDASDSPAGSVPEVMDQL
jgi:hypothetical protein